MVKHYIVALTDLSLRPGSTLTFPFVPNMNADSKRELFVLVPTLAIPESQICHVWLSGQKYSLRATDHHGQLRAELGLSSVAHR